MMFKKVSVPPATSKGAGGHGRKTPWQEPRGGGFRPGRRALAPSGDAGMPNHSAALSSFEQAAERPQLVRLQPGIPGKGVLCQGLVPRLLRAHTGTY